jgi:hypothetical protein
VVQIHSPRPIINDLHEPLDSLSSFSWLRPPCSAGRSCEPSPGPHFLDSAKLRKVLVSLIPEP